MSTSISSPAKPTSTRSKKARGGSAQGLRITRRFTTEGVDPYDMVTWTRRDIVQKDWRTDTTIFEQYGVEFPDFWSENAATIATTKYFRGAPGSDAREHSLRQLIGRVVDMYSKAGKDNGYFATDADADAFHDELTWLLLNQYFAFNSPVWFNVGTAAPQQVSACFILAVDDTMDSILNWYREEGLIFKGGSGAGLNLSRIRSSKELLSSGGNASGPVSFMRGADASAGTIKSGGACLAPWTNVYTAEEGPVSVSTLAARGTDFTTVSYNPVKGRMEATRARAFASGTKRLMKLTTDKGVFTMSGDHPVLLMSGGYTQVGDLVEGMSIRPASITINDLGYHRVGLHDGNKGKESVHRLVAQDVLGFDISDQEVHHMDRNPEHNGPDNLTVMSRAEHLRTHAAEDFEAGTHPFQQFHGVGNHPQIAGDRNGMSAVSNNRTDEYRARQIDGMHRHDVYRQGQTAAARQRMLNKAYAIVNSGGSIDTFDDYYTGRITLAGGLGYSKDKQLAKITERFGTYDAFREEVRASNHRVLSVEPLHDSVVYDVEVDSDTVEDRSVHDGHNFMIVSETNAQKGYTGILVHNTRRAAKMVVLDVDHPDIEEFVDTKWLEEDKIRALRDAGYDMDLGGKDITSVQYQNANNSVRVTDEFMQAVEANTMFGLRARATGDVVDTVNAKDLFMKIAQAAWACADPGIQYQDTINAWHTNSVTGPITASNPCSEYMSLDNSSCNLASLNLLKFLNDDGTYNVDDFVHVVRLVITAMDVSICFADFPTEAIGQTTRDYRQLGIGYANLGALLMALGLAYDSDEGRNVAAAITDLMTATAYERSAELAGIVGPYNGYARNEAPHRNVMAKHEQAHQQLRAFTPIADQLHDRAGVAWKTSYRTGSKFGWRNAQASLLAPAGTIGFIMDCDTTGIEPDFSLVKNKKLVGGGSMKIVNHTMIRALTHLGYSSTQIDDIVTFVAEHNSVIGAPHIAAAHHSVFATAVGDNAIEPDGHVLMMAAVQPFLSGAISKTVNLPETATVDDIAAVYMRGWTLGLKALAVYRDNCKVGQPLSTKASTVDAPVAVEPVRRRLPQTRTSRTTKFTMGDVEGYLTTGEHEDGTLGEMFIRVSKQGSTLSGIMDGLAMAVSVGLQYGVPLETFVAKYVNSAFDPAGMTNDPDIRMSKSLLDYIFRRLALDYLPTDVRQGYGIYTITERTAAVETGSYDTAPAVVDVTVAPVGRTMDAPLCATCGCAMVRSGSCYACGSCGSTTGCS